LLIVFAYKIIYSKRIAFKFITKQFFVNVGTKILINVLQFVSFA
jgi:hypothetical protein